MALTPEQIEKLRKIAKESTNALAKKTATEKLKAAGVSLTEKAEPKKASKKTMEKAFGKEFMKSKDKGSLKTYPDKKPVNKAHPEILRYEEEVLELLEEDGMDRSDAQGMFETKANQEIFDKGFKSKKSAKATAAAMLKAGEPKKAEPKGKAAPKDSKFSSKEDEDYCNELLEREKARHASSKKSAAKSPAKKSEAAIEKTVDAIEKKFKEGDLTKAQILAMIKDLRKKIIHLEKLLKTAK